MEEKKYKIIYADPPWEYRKSGGIKSARGLAKKYYKTMPLEEIKKLPIKEISEKSCCLFLSHFLKNEKYDTRTSNSKSPRKHQDNHSFVG